MREGLPVDGYTPQPDDAISLVNVNKQIEERVMRIIDAFVGDPRIDPRWLGLARDQIEQGFMSLNRAIFRPGRVKLPEDV